MEILSIRLRSISSTQDWLRDWARMQAREGIILQAREQTAGRGRLNHTWESATGGLYLSVLLRPRIPLPQAQKLTMMVSLAAIDACTEVASVTPRPKWPNDLLLGRKKLAGVLTELESDGPTLRYAIIGLGLNVNNDFSGSPLADIATSLKQATGRSHSINALAEAFARALQRRYAHLHAGAAVHHAWAQDLEPLGRQVTVLRPNQKPLHGLAYGVSPAGALLVRDTTGGKHIIWAGDVVVNWDNQLFE